VSPAPSSFTFEPLFLALAAVAAVLYFRVARAERPSLWRIVLFSAGLLLIAGALNSPLETIAANYLLLFHLLQNVMIADWAPPLLILGLTPAMRASVARPGGKPFAVLTRPRIALPLWLVGWYAIHLALFYDFALEHAWTLNVEHLLLIATGFVFWWPVLADEPADFASTPFYDFYADAPRLWGISAVRDQNFGGILMNVEQALVFLAAILYFVVKLIPEEEHTRADA
jgi:putative membrane protein